MTLSMTGYGRGIKTTPEYIITIDVKSVNHRYLDINFRIPKSYSFLEDRLRRELTTRLSRGKVDVVVNIESYRETDIQIELNRSVVNAYLKSIVQLKDEFGLTGEVDIPTLINLPEVFHQTEAAEDQETICNVAVGALEEALGLLMQMRTVEGQKLTDDLKNRLNGLEVLRSRIMVQSPSIVTSYQEKLIKRIGELTDGIEIDPNRIAVEVAIFADKSDINEELVRIESHIHQFLNALTSSEPIGRRLDFLIQELNREINTVGSKANDLQISQIVIEFKSELEKLREQVQNIE